MDADAMSVGVSCSAGEQQRALLHPAQGVFTAQHHTGWTANTPH